MKPRSFCGSELWCWDHVSRKQQFNRKNVKLMNIATHHFLLESNCRECYNHTWVLWNLKAPKLTFFRWPEARRVGDAFAVDSVDSVSPTSPHPERHASCTRLRKWPQLPKAPSLYSRELFLAHLNSHKNDILSRGVCSGVCFCIVDNSVNKVAISHSMVSLSFLNIFSRVC